MMILCGFLNGLWVCVVSMLLSISMLLVCYGNMMCCWLSMLWICVSVLVFSGLLLL